MTVTDTPPTTAVELRRYRRVAYADGPVVALAALHTAISRDVLPVGPGGHSLLPVEVDAACTRYTTPTGLRGRGDEIVVGRIAVGADELVARCLPNGGPDGPAWSTGVGWVRLGLAERLIARAAAHLRGRAVAGTTTLNLPMVRAMVADAAEGIAEARALLEGDFTGAALRQVHHGLDEVGRCCLHLFGAFGFLTDGPGSEVRVSELLSDTYPPPTDLEAL